MSNVFSSLKPRNSVGKNGFDLSRRSVFSAKCGQILPVFCQATLPDSEYKIDLKQLLRTQPLQTAAFSGFSVNYDFFFVPNNYSYSSFNEFISQRSDARHVNQPSHTVVPKFGFKAFVSQLFRCAVWDYLLESNFRAYGFDSDSIDFVDRPHFILASPNAPWCSLSLECIRCLDMLGYGNFLPMVKFYAQSVQRDIGAFNSFIGFKTAIENRMHAIGVSSFSLSTTSDIVQAMSALCEDTENDNGFQSLVNNFPDINPTLWPVLAYNKAFYEFYRNVYYDETYIVVENNISNYQIGNSTFEYVQLFNIDDWDSRYLTLSGTLSLEFKRLVAIFVPKYHLYKKDLFTGVLPSTQFGDISVMLGDTDYHDMVYKLVDGTTVPSLNWQAAALRNLNSTPSSELGLGTIIGNTFHGAQVRLNPSIAVSILEQRRADAMQRFRERMLRAGNKVKDVFKAHGWGAPYSASESTPFFLGTFDGRLDINTVASTTETESLELGQLGANGVAVVNGNTIRFKCHDFGTIVGVLYIVKESEYDAYGVERQHCLTDVFDYPYPELQNISLFPIDVLEVSSYLKFGGINRLFSSDILGYLPRFMEYKTALDKVHGEFYTAPFYALDSGNEVLQRSYGVFSDWVSPRVDLNQPTSLAFLYQSPNVADSIFKVSADALQSSDQFLINCYFDVMAVEPVSVIGLPI